MIPLPLAQVVDPEIALIAYVFISVVFLVGVSALLWAVKPPANLIVTGLFTAVAAMGYGTLIAGPTVALAPTMMKIAFLLVLSGVVLMAIHRPANNAPQPPVEDRNND